MVFSVMPMNWMRCRVFTSLGAILLAGCHARMYPPAPTVPPVNDDKSALVEKATARARNWLRARIGPDGAWRSETYASFRDGASLTPLALLALAEQRTPTDFGPDVRRGTEYLAKLARPDGTIESGQHGPSYPVYTAALAVRVLSLPGAEPFRAARDAWLADLRRRQLDETLGWSPDDKEYGGWGYCHGLPRKPKAGELVPPLVESNLSATAFALDALRAAGVPADDPAYRKAMGFINRCQNLPDDPSAADPRFDDGGFFFIYDDPARNKPGPAGRDGTGRERFRSYGSTTADGYRALRLCGLPPEHARVKAALGWLRRHFDGAVHSGDYPPERSGDRRALDFYYAGSLTQSLGDLPADEARAWAGALADGLMAQQQEDGSWQNPCKAVREDDPVLATALATAALARCRPYLP
jgi:squalene-hopene/tetraprenyl-beta-curcumene cyclase